MNRRQIIQTEPSPGVTPAVVLINPKSAFNVGNAVRNCSCFGARQLWWTGSRISFSRVVYGELHVPQLPKQRVPREERMKAYRDVEIFNLERPLDNFQGVTPVAVEVLRSGERLYDFVHPENPVYIFGPEDGGLDSSILALCHRFVTIPSNHCLNLASAVAITLFHRWQQRYAMGHVETIVTPGEFEKRGVLV
jgi:tRNA(Leu) C34 or U34 (ribose-2'-O)-methylase TrmL